MNIVFYAQPKKLPYTIITFVIPFDSRQSCLTISYQQKCRYKIQCARQVSVITFIRYAPNRKIGKPIKLKAFREGGTLILRVIKYFIITIYAYNLYCYRIILNRVEKILIVTGSRTTTPNKLLLIKNCCYMSEECYKLIHTVSCDCIFVPHNISYNRNQTVYNKSSPEQMLYNICSTFIKEFPGINLYICSIY